MIQNDAKLFKMMQNGSNYDTEWYKMMQNYAKLYKIIQNDTEWNKTIQTDTQ